MAKKDKLLIVHEDETCELVTVKDVSDQNVETDRGLYPLSEIVTKLDIRNGHLLHIINLDMPARVEVDKLKHLRRSVALRRMFEFDVKKKSDMTGYIPWVIILALILFK